MAVEEYPTFGLQWMGHEDPHPWIGQVLWSAVWVAYMLMLITGGAPWQGGN